MPVPRTRSTPVPRPPSLDPPDFGLPWGFPVCGMVGANIEQRREFDVPKVVVIADVEDRVKWEEGFPYPRRPLQECVSRHEARAFRDDRSQSIGGLR